MLPDKPQDRPVIDLALTPEGLRIQWERGGGPPIKRWWLYVGTQAPTTEKDNKKDEDRGYKWEIFHGEAEKGTSKLMPLFLLPKGKKVYAQVLGVFDSKDLNDKPIEEAIYSDVDYVMIPLKK